MAATALVPLPLIFGGAPGILIDKPEEEEEAGNPTEQT
jgi:hypothetical protein